MSRLEVSIPDAPLPEVVAEFCDAVNDAGHTLLEPVPGPGPRRIRATTSGGAVFVLTLTRIDVEEAP